MSAAKTLAAALICALAGVAAPAAAQDLEPRAYANTPVGVNFAIAGYAHSSGEVTTDSSIPLDDAKVRIDGSFLALARSLELLGKSAKLDLMVPYAWESGSAEYAGQEYERSLRGLGDPRLRFSVNLYGAPALSLEEFKSYRQDLIVGASLQVLAPLGQYDHDKLLNVGNNRWAFKPEIGVSKLWGPLILELSLAGTFYTDNHDFLDGREREQEPIYSAQLHAIYSFPFEIWGALDFTYYKGGESSIDGVSSHDLQSNTRVGATLALPVNRWNSLKLYASRGTSARAGGRYDTFGLAWQVRWGGGL